MADDRDPGFRRWRREADERVRRLNRAELDDKVVAFRPRTPERPQRTPWQPGALTYWALIVAVLALWVCFDRLVLAA